jgi:SAM-dependent methyltransferase
VNAEPPRSAADLPDFYAAGYSLADPAEAARMGEWRALGARVKAGHVQRLLRRLSLSPRSLVEIGCGDGALLAELHARGVAPVLDGFEVSEPAARMAAGRGVARRVEAYDGVRVPADDGAYDLAVLSHVVEHVPEPLPLLQEAARVARWVLVEVPLEDNRSAARPAKRAEAARIGHVQFFSRPAIRDLLAEAGIAVRAELSDPLPREHHAFFSPGPAATAKWAARLAAWRLAPRRAEQLFTVHYAAVGRGRGGARKSSRSTGV